MPGNLTNGYKTLTVRPILFLALLGVFVQIFRLLNTQYLYKSFQSLTSKCLSYTSGKERGTLCL